MRSSLAGLMFWMGWAACLPAMPAEMLADLAPGSHSEWQGPSGFAALERGAVFLRADNDQYPGLWVTDGTPAGTRALAVMSPPGGAAGLLGSNGRIAFYVANQNWSTGDEALIWRTDGTPLGTFPISGTLTPPKFPRRFRFAMGTRRLFFTACTPEQGCELWASDGTVAGTGIAAELVPGPAGPPIEELIVAGDRAFLFARAPTPTLALWTLDGHRLEFLATTPLPRSIVSAAGRLFFLAEAGGRGSEVWASDGTRAGTRPVTNFAPPDPFRVGLRPIGPSVYFSADDGVHGYEVWSADSGGARRLTDFAAADVYAYPFATAGGRVLLAKSKDYGWEIWTTRGKPSTTQRLVGCPGGCPTLETIGSGQLADGRRVLYGRDGQGFGFWTTDGRAAGTQLLMRGQTVFSDGDLVLFASAAGRVMFETTREYELGHLWITDGSVAGTFEVARGGPSWSHYWGFSGALEVGTAQGRMLFAAYPDDEGALGLWSSDGTPAGSAPLVRFDLGNGSYSSGLTPFRGGVVAQTCIDYASDLYFLRAGESVRLVHIPGACNPSSYVPPKPVVLPAAVVSLQFGEYTGDGRILGRILATDGTAAGTVPLAGTEEAQPWYPVPLGDRAVFTMHALPQPTQLWATDGTAGGTLKLFDFPPGVHPSRLFPVGDRVFFQAAEFLDGSWVYRVWVSDGTAAGTRVLTTAPGRAEGIASFVELAGRVWFPFAAGSGPREIWSTDGTAAGTAPALRASAGFVEPLQLRAVLGRLFFAAGRAGDPSGRAVQWVSDGTSAGTSPLANVPLRASGADFDQDYRVVEIGDAAFFAAVDPLLGDELWRTDGTPEGTERFLDIAPGILGSFPRELTVVNEQLYFRARDPLHGMELWVSDGTPEGTRIADDIEPGPSWSMPMELTAAPEGLYFSAQDRGHGREPWILPIP